MIGFLIRSQAERTGRAVGKRMADTDVDYLIAVLIFSELAQVPGAISIEEARLIWRKAEDAVLPEDSVNGYLILRKADGRYDLARRVSDTAIQPDFGGFATRDAAVEAARLFRPREIGRFRLDRREDGKVVVSYADGSAPGWCLFFKSWYEATDWIEQEG